MGNCTATKLNPNRSTGLASQAERGANYVESISVLLKEPWFIGWHWCAYVENPARGWGIKDPWDEPYQDFVVPVTEFNKQVYEKVRSSCPPGHLSGRDGSDPGGSISGRRICTPPARPILGKGASQ
jgi:hypothetical protein